MKRLLAFVFFSICASGGALARDFSAAGFEAWRAGFRAQALHAGVKATVFDRAFANVHYSASSRKQGSNQSEFVRPIWEYLDSALSRQRIAEGRRKARDLKTSLRRIRRNSGVDPAILLAIWGLESSYGGFRGNTYTIEALANAAYTGRRRDFAETELLAALEIITRGEVVPERMRGSWGGAMGHTQFMPTTFLRYAIDGNGDGRRDIWEDDPRDALASTAHYLRQLGWMAGQPWGTEVTLPKAFDYSLSGELKAHPAAFWRARGVRLASGRPLPDGNGPVALLVPAGARGPVFAVYSNFQALRRYNKSVSYALAVGLLANRLRGAPALMHPWPRDEKPLNHGQIKAIQQALMAQGLDTGGADGKIGPKTIQALQIWQKRHGMLADGHATHAIWKVIVEAK